MNSLFRLFAAVPVLLLARTAAAAPVPLADFARHAQFEDVKISPDGAWLAASAVIDDKTVLSLVHLADM